jgi:hypothetical protein
MVEGSEFELPVPVSKLSRRQHHVRICDGQTNCPYRAETTILSALLRIGPRFSLEDVEKMPEIGRVL